MPSAQPSGGNDTIVVNHAFMGALGLGTTLATLGSSWWAFDPAEYDGAVYSWRLVVVIANATANDNIEFIAYDVDAATSILSATVAISRVNGDRLATPWSTAPTVEKGGYVRARNATAARGGIHQAWIELKRA